MDLAVLALMAQTSAWYDREEVKFVEHLLCAKYCSKFSFTHDNKAKKEVLWPPLFRGENTKLEEASVPTPMKAP